MSKLICFSGACNTGKTTTILKVKEYLENNNIKVVVLDELIRSKGINSIDTIRMYCDKYFELQLDIISGKIKQERDAYNDPSDTFYLIDRSLSDSLYYYTNFVNVDNLSPKNRGIYYEFLSKIISELNLSLFNYDLIINFEISDVINSNKDKMRPSNLEEINSFESLFISCLNNKVLEKNISFKVGYSDLSSIYKKIDNL